MISEVRCELGCEMDKESITYYTSQAGSLPPPNNADSTPNALAALRDEDVPSLDGNDDRSDDEIHVYDA